MTIEIRKWGDRPKSRYVEKFPGKTEQSHKKACDINNIMAKFVKTGVLEHEAKYKPQYGDFYSADDFTQSMYIVAEANSVFAELPAETRKEFDNDPAKYLAHIEEHGALDPDRQGKVKADADAEANTTASEASAAPLGS